MIRKRQTQLLRAFLMIGTLSAGLSLKAQDLQFSQFYNVRTLYNPAAAGAFNGEHRASLHYRSQWASVATPFTSYAMSYDASLFKKDWKNSFLGLGFQAWSDKAGEHQLGTTRAGLSVAYHLEANDNNWISGGLSAGFAQMSINPTTMQWDNQYDGVSGWDGSIAAGEIWNFESFSAAEIAAGVLWSFSTGDATLSSNDGMSLEAGASVYHLTRPVVSYYDTEEDRRYMKMNFHANALIGLKNTPLGLVPGVLYSRQGPNSKLLIGTGLRFILVEGSRYTGNIKETAITIGGHVRRGDAFIGSFGLEYANFALAFSYDMNTSELRSASNGNGGMEITLRYTNPNPFKGGAQHNKFF